MADTKFIKHKEDFTCDKCGTLVHGNGYTNHCPKCLWSKHVDTNPGDRAAECAGLMEPVGLLITGHNQEIVHRCKKCGKQLTNRVSSLDDSDALIALSKRVFK
jgi:rubrerythrin